MGQYGMQSTVSCCTGLVAAYLQRGSAAQASLECMVLRAVANWILVVLGVNRMTHPPLHAITARPLARAGHPRTACHIFRSGFKREGGRQVADNRLSA
jgi:hypothetical protein